MKRYILIVSGPTIEDSKQFEFDTKKAAEEYYLIRSVEKVKGQRVKLQDWGYPKKDEPTNLHHTYTQTDEEVAQEAQETFIRWYTSRIAGSMERIKDWAASLIQSVEKEEGDPTYHARWSSLHEQTAMLFVCRQIKEWHQAGRTIAEIMVHANEQVLRFCRSDLGTSRSTNLYSNLNEDCIAKAWAQAMEQTRWL